MLQHIESLVREHVGAEAATQGTKTENAVKTTGVQHPVERMRGGLSSSPIATFAGTGRTPKPESKPVPLPLPRRVHRNGGALKVAPVRPTVVGGSKEEPIVLDDDNDAPMDVVDSKDASVRAEHTGQTVAQGNGKLSDVASFDSVKAQESIVPAATTSQDLTSAESGTSKDGVKVKTEEVAESLSMQPLKQGASPPGREETLPGDTSEEEEPLSAVIKAKRANALMADERPMIRINLKQHRSASNLLSESTPSSTPLRIRIPSLRKSSPSRIFIPPFPSEPPSPSVFSSPSSPNLPTSTADTPWDSDLSDLTPIEDSTDEGESEVDEPDPAGDAGEERPRVSG